eukprot:139068-Prorocentrum_minimum.AAC.2
MGVPPSARCAPSCTAVGVMRKIMSGIWSALSSTKYSKSSAWNAGSKVPLVTLMPCRLAKSPTCVFAYPTGESTRQAGNSPIARTQRERSRQRHQDALQAGDSPFLKLLSYLCSFFFSFFFFSPFV